MVSMNVPVLGFGGEGVRARISRPGFRWALTYADFLRISAMYLLRLTRLRTAARASFR